MSSRAREEILIYVCLQAHCGHDVAGRGINSGRRTCGPQRGRWAGTLSFFQFPAAMYTWVAVCCQCSCKSVIPSLVWGRDLNPDPGTRVSYSLFSFIHYLSDRVPSSPVPGAASPPVMSGAKAVRRQRKGVMSQERGGEESALKVPRGLQMGPLGLVGIRWPCGTVHLSGGHLVA